jgi:hypothetical protein
LGIGKFQRPVDRFEKLANGKKPIALEVRKMGAWVLQYTVRDASNELKPAEDSAEEFLDHSRATEVTDDEGELPDALLGIEIVTIGKDGSFIGFVLFF